MSLQLINHIIRQVTNNKFSQERIQTNRIFQNQDEFRSAFVYSTQVHCKKSLKRETLLFLILLSIFCWGGGNIPPPPVHAPRLDERRPLTFSIFISQTKAGRKIRKITLSRYFRNLDNNRLFIIVSLRGRQFDHSFRKRTFYNYIFSWTLLVI